MKQTIKQQIFNQRERLNKNAVKEKSLQIKKNLYSLPEFKNAKNILFYVSFNSEADTHDIIKEQLNKKEKAIVVPFVEKDNPILQLSELKNFNELESKTFGILEPKNSYIREFSCEKLDIVLIPGIGFDEKGHRIGYGYGYYDRFLKKLRKETKKICLAFDFQIVDKIPKEAHDVPVDIIVTETRIIRCRK